jgi:hypothetical protein
MDELSAEELAGRSGVTAEQLRRLVELGIITPTPQGRYRPSDIQRIRVVDALADAGFASEQLGQLIASTWTPVLPNRSAVIDSSTTTVRVLVVPGSSPMRVLRWLVARVEWAHGKATGRPSGEEAVG